MNHSFVLIFRKSRRTLTEEEQKQRTRAVREWALQQVEEHRLEPRVLDDESHELNERGTNKDDEQAVIALNFIEAKQFGEAVEIAKTHPGLRYACLLKSDRGSIHVTRGR